MTLHKPVYMQPAGGDPDFTLTGAEMRALVTAQWPHGGIIRPSDFTVTQRGAGANFSVDVAAGFAVIEGDDVANQGNYLDWSDATFNLVTPGAPGSGTRLHRVVLQQRDKLNNGSWTQYDFIPVLVQDTGSGFPAEPASALTLAQVSIAAAQANVSNANIADMRTQATVMRRWKPGGTSRTATTRTPDPDLTLVMAGNSVYEIEAFLDFTTTGSEKLFYGWDRPSGSTGNWGHVANIGGAPGINNYGYGWSFTETAAHQTTSASDAVQLAGMIFVPAGNPQVFDLSWASAGGVSVTLNQGSWIRATRVD